METFIKNRQKKLVQFFLLLPLLITTSLLSDSSLANSTQNLKPIKIALFGDSLIAGYGLNKNDDLATKLNLFFQKNQSDINIEFINFGVSGDTTIAALNRTDWLIDEIKPNVVFLAIGANDMLRGINPDLIKENLLQIISKLQKSKIKIVLSRVVSAPNLGGDYQNKFNQIYDELARSYNLSLYPFLIEPTYQNPDLMQNDGLHPNAKGIQVIADKLADFFKTLIKNNFENK